MLTEMSSFLWWFGQWMWPMFHPLLIKTGHLKLLVRKIITNKISTTRALIDYVYCALILVWLCSSIVGCNNFISIVLERYSCVVFDILMLLSYVILTSTKYFNWLCCQLICSSVWYCWCCKETRFGFISVSAAYLRHIDYNNSVISCRVRGHAVIWNNISVANHCGELVFKCNPDTKLISAQCIWFYIFIAFLEVIALGEQTGCRWIRCA